MAHNFTRDITDQQGKYMFTICTQCGCRNNDEKKSARCPSNPNAPPASKFDDLDSMWGREVASPMNAVRDYSKDEYVDVLEGPDSSYSPLDAFCSYAASG